MSPDQTKELPDPKIASPLSQSCSPEPSTSFMPDSEAESNFTPEPEVTSDGQGATMEFEMDEQM